MQIKVYIFGIEMIVFFWENGKNITFLVNYFLESQKEKDF